MVEVQAEPITRGRNPRIHDVEPQLIEHSSGPGKPIPPRPRENQNRGSPPHTARIQRNERLIRPRIPLRQQARMPRHFFRRVLQEIRRREPRPGPRNIRLGHPALDQQPPSRILRFPNELLLVDRTLQPTPQRPLHTVVKVVEQRILPRIPQLRIRPAHVRASQHVQVIEVVLIAHAARERVDDLRVADILLLRSDGQLEMVPHQPGHQARIVRGEPLLETERLGIHATELRMIPAATLGDVMKQGREIGDLGLRQLLHDPRGLRHLVVIAGYGKPPQVADDKQSMRIDGIRMEQVVLHAPHDAPERGDITTEHAVGVHPAQLVRHTNR